MQLDNHQSWRSVSFTFLTQFQCQKKQLHCPISILSQNSILNTMHRCFEIWCGVSKGKMVALEFDGGTNALIKQHQLKHNSEYSVTILASSTTSIFAYPSPGCILYQWSAADKKIINQIDCLKLVPCSESLGSISIDKTLSVGRCQVNSFASNTSSTSIISIRFSSVFR